MADMLHVISHFGGVENLKGKKVAMTWAYSPSCGKPLPSRRIIDLFTRFGMDVCSLTGTTMAEVEETPQRTPRRAVAPTSGSIRWPRRQGCRHRLPEERPRSPSWSGPRSSSMVMKALHTLEQACSPATPSSDWTCTEER